MAKSDKPDSRIRLRGYTWQKIRERVFSRDCGLCVPCQLKGKITPATEVDHIQPIHKGGTDSLDNLQSICDECHKDKTADDKGYTRRPEIGLDGWPIG